MKFVNGFKLLESRCNLWKRLATVLCWLSGDAKS